LKIVFKKNKYYKRKVILSSYIQAGFKTVLLSSCIAGEAKKVGELYAALTERLLHGNTADVEQLLHGLDPQISESVHHDLKEALGSGHPLAVLGGGETTVKVTGSGKGGRNQELALAYSLQAQSLIKDPRYEVEFMSCGTDGIDGPTDAAGAFITRSANLLEIVKKL